MSILTRGFGEGGGLISRGHGVVIQAIEAITTYTSQVVKRATREALRVTDELIDTYKVTVSLISVNREELIYPATSTKRGEINRSKEIMVSINNFAVSNVYKPAYKIVINILNVVKGIT